MGRGGVEKWSGEGEWSGAEWSGVEREREWEREWAGEKWRGDGITCGGGVGGNENVKNKNKENNINKKAHVQR